MSIFYEIFKGKYDKENNLFVYEEYPLTVSENEKENMMNNIFKYAQEEAYQGIYLSFAIASIKMTDSTVNYSVEEIYEYNNNKNDYNLITSTKAELTRLVSI